MTEEALKVLPRFEALGTEVHSLFNKNLPDDLLRVAGVAKEDHLVAGNATMVGTDEIVTASLFTLSFLPDHQTNLTTSYYRI